MVRVYSPHIQNANKRRSELYRKTIAVIVATLVTNSVTKKRKPPQPKRTSILTGHLWLQELIEGHPIRFHEQLGLSRYAFQKLSQELQQSYGLVDSRWVKADEMLAIFLYFARHGSSSRMLQERFQRSGDTISKVIHRLTRMLIGSFYRKYVKPMPNVTPSAIEQNPCLYPWFKNARGAIDGSGFDSRVEEEAIARYRSRKGRVSQNVLAASSWDLMFVYMLTGWEGSAADSRVFDYARKHDLRVPEGCYFLADAGFPLCDMLMTPYRGVRYHLQEWRRGNSRPQNYEELYNLRHAQARNVIERIFGIFKRRFSLTIHVPEYSTTMQSQFICALAALHNFIRYHDPADRFVCEAEAEFRNHQNSQIHTNGVRDAPQAAHSEPSNSSISAAERQRAGERRDRIANAMWIDYQEELIRRGLL